MNATLSTCNGIPPHLLLLAIFIALLVAYYIRPDPVTQDLLKGVFGALLLSLNLTPKTP